jgi:hypothetical protein
VRGSSDPAQPVEVFREQGPGIDRSGVVEPLQGQSVPQRDDPQRLQPGVAVAADGPRGVGCDHVTGERGDEPLVAAGEVGVGGMGGGGGLRAQRGLQLDEAGSSAPGAADPLRQVPDSGRVVRSGYQGRLLLLEDRDEQLRFQSAARPEAAVAAPTAPSNVRGLMWSSVVPGFDRAWVRSTAGGVRAPDRGSRGWGLRAQTVSVRLPGPWPPGRRAARAAPRRRGDRRRRACRARKRLRRPAVRRPRRRTRSARPGP